MPVRIYKNKGTESGQGEVMRSDRGSGATDGKSSVAKGGN